jgi:hypothetical protein
MARTYLVFGDIEGKLDVQFVAPFVAPERFCGLFHSTETQLTF